MVRNPGAFNAAAKSIESFQAQSVSANLASRFTGDTLQMLSKNPEILSAMVRNPSGFQAMASNPAALAAFVRNAGTFEMLSRKPEFGALIRNPGFAAAIRTNDFAQAMATE
jgi:hypothetical protein